jgi:hypothetical protein
MDDNTFWYKLWTLVVAGSTVIIVTMLICYMMTTKAAFNSGYQRATLPGSQGAHWVKLP